MRTSNKIKIASGIAAALIVLGSGLSLGIIKESPGHHNQLSATNNSIKRNLMQKNSNVEDANILGETKLNGINGNVNKNAVYKSTWGLTYIGVDNNGVYVNSSTNINTYTKIKYNFDFSGTSFTGFADLNNNLYIAGTTGLFFSVNHGTSISYVKSDFANQSIVGVETNNSELYTAVVNTNTVYHSSTYYNFESISVHGINNIVKIGVTDNQNIYFAGTRHISLFNNNQESDVELNTESVTLSNPTINKIRIFSKDGTQTNPIMLVATSFGLFGGLVSSKSIDIIQPFSITAGSVSAVSIFNNNIYIYSNSKATSSSGLWSGQTSAFGTSNWLKPYGTVPAQQNITSIVQGSAINDIGAKDEVVLASPNGNLFVSKSGTDEFKYLKKSLYTIANEDFNAALGAIIINDKTGNLYLNSFKSPTLSQVTGISAGIKINQIYKSKIDSTIYVCTSLGLYKSENGVNFSLVSGLPEYRETTAVFQASNGDVYVSIVGKHNGDAVVYYSDNGQNFTACSNPHITIISAIGVSFSRVYEITNFFQFKSKIYILCQFQFTEGYGLNINYLSDCLWTANLGSNKFTTINLDVKEIESNDSVKGVVDIGRISNFYITKENTLYISLIFTRYEINESGQTFNTYSDVYFSKDGINFTNLNSLSTLAMPVANTYQTTFKEINGIIYIYTLTTFKSDWPIIPYLPGLMLFYSLNGVTFNKISNKMPDIGSGYSTMNIFALSDGSIAFYKNDPTGATELQKSTDGVHFGTKKVVNNYKINDVSQDLIQTTDRTIFENSYNDDTKKSSILESEDGITFTAVQGLTNFSGTFNTAIYNNKLFVITSDNKIYRENTPSSFTQYASWKIKGTFTTSYFGSNSYVYLGTTNGLYYLS